MESMTTPKTITKTTCCIVGGGPGGLMLALLLGRAGIPVILLEARKDFDRDFRGDSVNPSVMLVMDQIGLAEKLHELPHARIGQITLRTPFGSHLVTDYSILKTKYPYITVMPQVQFLNVLAKEAESLPSCTIERNAPVVELIEEDGSVKGVRYKRGEEWHEVRSSLVVGADGRASRVRRMAGIELAHQYPQVFDVLWFRLPRNPLIPKHANLGCYFGKGYYFALSDRFDYWQVAYVIPKGAYQELRSRGMESFRRSIQDLAPEFASGVASLESWDQLSVLSVQMARVDKWYRPGLLLIGDAAHVMSSVGGVGISCAIQDAVSAFNLLSPALRTGLASVRDLAAVQRQREWPIRIMQFLQRMSERSLVARAVDVGRPFKVPLSLRLPFMKRLTAAVIAYGIHSVRVRN